MRTGPLYSFEVAVASPMLNSNPNPDLRTRGTVPPVERCTSRQWAWAAPALWVVGVGRLWWPPATSVPSAADEVLGTGGDHQVPLGEGLQDRGLPGLEIKRRNRLVIPHAHHLKAVLPGSSVIRRTVFDRCWPGHEQGTEGERCR